MIFNINFLFLIKKHIKGFSNKNKGVGDFWSPREHGPIIAALVPLALPPCRHKYEQDMYIFLWTSQIGLRKTRSIFKVKEKAQCYIICIRIYDGASIYVNLGHSEKPKKCDKFGKNESSTTCMIDINGIILVPYIFTHILL